MLAWRTGSQAACAASRGAVAASRSARFAVGATRGLEAGPAVAIVGPAALLYRMAQGSRPPRTRA
jgi:hypothetical protein